MEKYWRPLLAILFLLALLAPWLQITYHGVYEITGFVIIWFVGDAYISTIIHPIYLLSSLPLLLLLLPALIGVVCLLLYILLNLMSSIDWAEQRLVHWRKHLLMGITLGMLEVLVVIVFVSFQGTRVHAWGYWLAWIGLLISIGLEFITTPISTKYLVANDLPS